MLSKWLKGLHGPLIFSNLALMIIGMVFIYSASYHDATHYETRQLFWALIGFAFFMGVPLIGYRTFLSMANLLYAISIVLLLVVLIGGDTHLGAQRWIQVGPMALQPSEIAKMSVIMVLANYLGSHQPWENESRIILTAVGIVLLPLVLIIKQPDLGTSLLLVPITFVLLFLWGLRFRYILFALIPAVLSAPLFWHFLKAYQKKRILVFLNPNLDPLGAGYTALQSRIAVGSGGLFGKGFLEGTQVQLKFVPEHHTDFIFCVIGEEWGFVGALALLIIYGFLFRSVFQIISHTTDFKAKLLGAGIVTVLFAQVFINIGMTIGYMPVTGLTLPLVSYGGSSFLATSIGLGMLLSIHKERSIF